MDNSLDTLCYIHEQTSYMEDYKDSFGYEVHETGPNRFYVTFPAVLQSFDVMNRNGRSYDANNIMECINTDDQIQSMLRQNSWMGEIDHPAAEKKGEELTVNRIANPDLKKTSHYIRKPVLNGNLLEANIQTDSSNENGMNMAIKIVDGKIVPCFSARVLGSLRNVMGKPVVHVNKLVTYDWVLYPSHKEAMAKIHQPLMESVNAIKDYAGKQIIFLKELAHMAANNSKETEWLCESFNLTIDDVVGLTSTGDSVVIQESGNIYIQPITDKAVRTKTQRGLSDWLNQ
jgi:hypothetical protein